MPRRGARAENQQSSEAEETPAHELHLALPATNYHTAFSFRRLNVLRSRLFMSPHLASIIGTTADAVPVMARPLNRGVFEAACPTHRFLIGALYLSVSQFGSCRDRLCPGSEQLKAYGQKRGA